MALAVTWAVILAEAVAEAEAWPRAVGEAVALAWARGSGGDEAPAAAGGGLTWLIQQAPIR